MKKRPKTLLLSLYKSLISILEIIIIHYFLTGAMFANVPREVDSQQLSAANLDFYQHYAANIANFHPAYRN